MPTPDVDTSIQQLSDPLPRRRAAAAKRLRQAGAAAAGPALLGALRLEIPDEAPPREETWEVQYQMIMALGECGEAAALPYLQDLASRAFAATTVYVALGDAITRLWPAHLGQAAAIEWCMETGNKELVSGAFRAAAMMRIIVGQSVAAQLLSNPCVSADPEPVGTWRLWPAAAAAGWEGPAVNVFLEQCLTSSRDDVRSTAAESLQGRYRRWNPL